MNKNKKKKKKKLNEKEQTIDREKHRLVICKNKNAEARKILKIFRLRIAP